MGAPRGGARRVPAVRRRARRGAAAACFRGPLFAHARRRPLAARGGGGAPPLPPPQARPRTPPPASLRLDAAAALSAAGPGGALGSADAFCAAAVDEAGVLLLPASVYDHGPSTAGGRFRVGLGRAATPAAFAALEAWLASRFPGAREAAG